MKGMMRTIRGKITLQTALFLIFSGIKQSVFDDVAWILAVFIEICQSETKFSIILENNFCYSSLYIFSYNNIIFS